MCDKNKNKYSHLYLELPEENFYPLFKSLYTTVIFHAMPLPSKQVLQVLQVIPDEKRRNCGVKHLTQERPRAAIFFDPFHAFPPQVSTQRPR